MYDYLELICSNLNLTRNVQSGVIYSRVKVPNAEDLFIISFKLSTFYYNFTLDGRNFRQKSMHGVRTSLARTHYLNKRS